MIIKATGHIMSSNHKHGDHHVEVCVRGSRELTWLRVPYLYGDNLVGLPVDIEINIDENGDRLDCNEHKKQKGD